MAGLHQFDQHTFGAGRVQEGHLVPVGAWTRLAVDESIPRLLQSGELGPDVLAPVGHVMQPLFFEVLTNPLFTKTAEVEQ